MTKKKPLEAVVTLRLRMTDGLRRSAAVWRMTEKEYFDHYVWAVRAGMMKPLDGSLVREDKS